jgi:hypothetical protein
MKTIIALSVLSIVIGFLMPRTADAIPPRPPFEIDCQTAQHIFDTDSSVTIPVHSHSNSERMI